MKEIKILIIEDMQDDFMPGGNLPISRGKQIIPYINKIIPNYDLVILTFDFHVPGHGSFKKYGKHCVQMTPGASIVEDIDLTKAKNVLPWFKGLHPKYDSTSAFTDEKGYDTGLFSAINAIGNPSLIDIVGVATSICVKDTAMDAKNLYPELPAGVMKSHGKFPTPIRVHANGVACLTEDSHTKALEEMNDAGIIIVKEEE